MPYAGSRKTRNSFSTPWGPSPPTSHPTRRVIPNGYTQPVHRLHTPPRVTVHRLSQGSSTGAFEVLTSVFVWCPLDLHANCRTHAVRLPGSRSRGGGGSGVGNRRRAARW